MIQKDRVSRMECFRTLIAAFGFSNHLIIFFCNSHPGSHVIERPTNILLRQTFCVAKKLAIHSIPKCLILFKTAHMEKAY